MNTSIITHALQSDLLFKHTPRDACEHFSEKKLDESEQNNANADLGVNECTDQSPMAQV